MCVSGRGGWLKDAMIIIEILRTCVQTLSLTFLSEIKHV